MPNFWGFFFFFSFVLLSSRHLHSLCMFKIRLYSAQVCLSETATQLFVLQLLIQRMEQPTAHLDLLISFSAWKVSLAEQVHGTSRSWECLCCHAHTAGAEVERN